MSARLTAKTVVMPVANEFEDIELLYPLLRLSEEGATVIVVPLALGFHPRPFLNDKPVTGRFGHPVPIPVMPEGRRYVCRTLGEIDPAAVDCLLVPGGFSPDYLRRDAKVLELVRSVNARGALLATICHGPWVFISAGVVRGRRMTGLVAVRDDLLNAGAEYVDAAVVCDGNLITSRMPNDLPDFCLEIIRWLSAGQE